MQRVLYLLTGLTLLLCATGCIALEACDSSPTAKAISRGLAVTPDFDRLVTGFAAEGSAVRAWRSRGQIVRIEVEALGERGRQMLDFYWDQRRLVFARIRTYDYGADIMELPSGPPTHEELVEDESMRFAGTHAQQWCGGWSIKPGAMQQRASELRVAASNYLLLMRTPHPPPQGQECPWECKRFTNERCRAFACMR